MPTTKTAVTKPPTTQQRPRPRSNPRPSPPPRSQPPSPPTFPLPPTRPNPPRNPRLNPRRKQSLAHPSPNLISLVSPKDLMSRVGPTTPTPTTSWTSFSWTRCSLPVPKAASSSGMPPPAILLIGIPPSMVYRTTSSTLSKSATYPTKPSSLEPKAVWPPTTQIPTPGKPGHPRTRDGQRQRH